MSDYEVAEVTLNGCTGFISRGRGINTYSIPDTEWNWVIELAPGPQANWTWTIFFVTHYGLEPIFKSVSDYWTVTDALQAARSTTQRFANPPVF